jgi:hypothetical protein
MSCTSQEIRKAGEVPAGTPIRNIPRSIRKDCRQNLSGLMRNFETQPVSNLTSQVSTLSAHNEITYAAHNYG